MRNWPSGSARALRAAFVRLAQTGLLRVSLQKDASELTRKVRDSRDACAPQRFANSTGALRLEGIR
jgi:hypothetical protein